MVLRFRGNKKFLIEISKTLKKVIEELDKTPTDAVIPARWNLFVVDDDLPLIEERRQKLFYRLVHKIYFCAPRGRKDFQLVTSFLTTRVGKCNEKDYAKLCVLINYTHD